MLPLDIVEEVVWNAFARARSITEFADWLRKQGRVCRYTAEDIGDGTLLVEFLKYCLHQEFLKALEDDEKRRALHKAGFLQNRFPFEVKLMPGLAIPEFVVDFKVKRWHMPLDTWHYYYCLLGAPEPESLSKAMASVYLSGLEGAQNG